MTLDVSFGNIATSKIVVTRGGEGFHSVLILTKDEAVELYHLLGRLLEENGLLQ